MANTDLAAAKDLVKRLHTLNPAANRGAGVDKFKDKLEKLEASKQPKDKPPADKGLASYASNLLKDIALREKDPEAYAREKRAQQLRIEKEKEAATEKEAAAASEGAAAAELREQLDLNKVGSADRMWINYLEDRVKNRSMAAEDTPFNSAVKGWLEVAKKVARAAGTQLVELVKLPYNRRNVHESQDGSLQTDANRSAYAVCLKMLSDLVPTHRVLCKSGSATKLEITESPTWIVNPMDATENFVLERAEVAVSLCLLVERHVSLAVVFNPFTDELFTACVGSGAFLNGRKLVVGNTARLEQSVVATEVGRDRGQENVDNFCLRMTDLMPKVRAFRMGGSVALDLCQVACGRLDAFYGVRIDAPWDTAAAALIVTEAGGKVADLQGNAEASLLHDQLMACNEKLMAPMVAALEVSTAITTMKVTFPLGGGDPESVRVIVDPTKAAAAATAVAVRPDAPDGSSAAGSSDLSSATADFDTAISAAHAAAAAAVAAAASASASASASAIAESGAAAGRKWRWATLPSEMLNEIAMEEKRQQEQQWERIRDDDEVLNTLSGGAEFAEPKEPMARALSPLRSRECFRATNTQRDTLVVSTKQTEADNVFLEDVAKKESLKLMSVDLAAQRQSVVELKKERKKYDEILVEAKAELNSFMATPPTGDSDEHQPTMDVLVNLVREAQIALDHVDKKIALAMTNGEEANFVPFNAMVPDNSRSFTSWFS